METRSYISGGEDPSLLDSYLCLKIFSLCSETLFSIGKYIIGFESIQDRVVSMFLLHIMFSWLGPSVLFWLIFLPLSLSRVVERLLKCWSSSNSFCRIDYLLERIWIERR